MEAMFTDFDGRVWHPRCTFAAITYIRDTLGADLMASGDREKITDLLRADITKLLAMFQQTVVHEEPDLDKSAAALEAGPFTSMMQAFNDALGIFLQGPDYERPTPGEEPDDEESDPT